MNFRVPYPCPGCGRMLYYTEGSPRLFNCPCGYFWMNGQTDGTNLNMEDTQ